jgi:sugar phosphate isomerase/epimerase
VGAEVIVVHVPRKHGEATLRLGGRTLRFPWPSPDRAVKRWIEGDLAAAQARTRVKIALENMPARQIAGQPLDATWWNEIDTWSQVHDHLTLDTTHWATKRINPLDAYHAAGARVAHVHLSNYNGHEHQLPHKGNLNLRAFLRALAADGFAGTVSLELTPHVLNYKDERGLRRIIGECLNFCREHLA